jgi:hypothetical protein
MPAELLPTNAMSPASALSIRATCWAQTARFAKNRSRPGTEHMPDSPLYPGGPTWEEIMNGEQQEDYQVCRR